MDKRKLSQKQEKRTAKQLNGKVTPGSGCIDNFKGDVRSDRFLCENKFTTTSYVLKKNVWDKIAKEALRDGIREPIIQLDFYRGMEVYSYVILDYFTFEEYFDIIFYHKTALFTTNKSITLHLEDILQWDKNFPFRWDIHFTNTCKLVMIELAAFLEVFEKE